MDACEGNLDALRYAELADLCNKPMVSRDMQDRARFARAKRKHARSLEDGTHLDVAQCAMLEKCFCKH